VHGFSRAATTGNRAALAAVPAADRVCRVNGGVSAGKARTKPEGGSGGIAKLSNKEG